MNVGRRAVAGVALAGLVVTAGILTSPERTLAALAGLSERPLVFAVVLLAVYLVRPFLAWPTMAVSVGVAVVLGPVVGLPVALAGTVVTSLPAYYLGGWFGGTDGPAGRFESGSRAYFRTTGSVRGVIAARLSPVPADAVSAAAGLSGVPLGTYATGTLVGELPWTLAAVVLGASARTVAAAGSAALSLPLLVATSLAALALLAGPLYRAVGRETLGA